MTSSIENPLLTEYPERRQLYADFAAMLGSLLTRILAEHGVPLHSVTHRAKDLDSLARKLQRPGHSHATLDDVTDLAGVRVTTYFHDHVDLIASIIEGEFCIDQTNSVDKRVVLDPNRFGYASLHYVVGLSPQRSQLSEYRRFHGLKAEIQIRSLLQHVWAEIEHDLGYKSTRSVPSPIRRRFARLAGMLELADAEFVAIREELSAYEIDVPTRIESEPAAVPLDKASLTAFERASEIMKALDAAVASYVGAAIKRAADVDIDSDLENLNFVGITTVGELDAALKEHEDAIKRFGQAWVGGSQHDVLKEGISIFYLTYVLLARQQDRNRIIQWAEAMNIGLESERAGLADRLLTIAATEPDCWMAPPANGQRRWLLRASCFVMAHFAYE